VSIREDDVKVCSALCQRENPPKTCRPYGDDQQTLRPSHLNCQGSVCTLLSQVLLWPPKNSVSSAVPSEEGSRRGDDLLPKQGEEQPLHLLRNELVQEVDTSFHWRVLTPKGGQIPMVPIAIQQSMTRTMEEALEAKA